MDKGRPIKEGGIKLYHSVTFDGKNSWDDWHLIPTSRPVIAQPERFTNYIEVPGVGGRLDASDLLSGHPIYSDRTGSLEFAVMHDYWSSWERTRTEISNHLSGRIIKVILEDDASYYYQGRCVLNEYLSEKDYSKVVIDYVFDPFKREVDLPVRFKNIQVNTTGTSVWLVPVTGTVAYDTPSFEVSNAPDEGLYVAYEDVWVHLKNGINYDSRIQVGPGNHGFSFKGKGTITINYRGGLL